METTSLDNTKSQRRIERQKRREERRKNRQKLISSQSQVSSDEKKKKSLPGFLGKYKHEISQWLRNYMTLFVKAEDAQIPWIKNMTREDRNNLIDEYVEVSNFRKQLDEYLKNENTEK